MSEYKNIPVEAARDIAARFDKNIVIINAWDAEYGKLHTVTYGKGIQDKIHAAKGGEICATALGMEVSKKETYEDFRTIGAAKNAQLRDLAPGIINCLRSYQHGNSSPDLAAGFADKLEAVLAQKESE